MIESILKGFDVWTDAQGVKSKGRIKSIDNISLEGIGRLRELIVKLGITGKLVPQVSSEESADILLDKIYLERKKLLDEGVIKKGKDIPSLEGETNLEVPNNWTKDRLGNLFNVVYGSGISTAELTPEGYEVFGANGIIGRYKTFNYENPQLLVSCRGAYSGKPNISPSNCFVTSNSLVLQNRWELLDMMFFYYQLSAIDRNKIITGSAQPQVTTKNLDLVILNIPPLAEQKRIVAKIEELLRICDKLEEQQTTNLTTHHHLVKSLLETLTNAADADELQVAWERLAEHFDTLFYTEDSIEQLKQTILQLAIMGRLVKQDPNDEPANILFDKIYEVKNNLIAEGLIRKQKDLDEINEDEMPFALPFGWIFERLNNVVDVRDGTHDSPKDAFGPNTYPLITSKDFKNGKIDFTEARRISESDHLEISKRSKVEKYDILFSMIGGNLGNQVMVLDDAEFSIKNVALLKYYSKELTLPYFIKNYTEHLAYDLQSRAIGGAQPFVSLGFLRNLVIGLPPINEQKRIVAKVEELISICDSLKEKITSSENIKSILSNTVVEVIS